MRKQFKDSFHWRWPFYAALIACAVYLTLIFLNNEVSEILFWMAVLAVLCVGLLIGLTFLFAGAWRIAASLISVALACVAVSFGLLIGSHPIRTAGRWAFNSGTYKTQVLSQAAPSPGDYRHIEWDGWGWGGNDTVVYLIYDPQDRLSAQGGSTFMLDGKPCEVSGVRRLERAWYAVTFSTGAAWNDCQ